MSQSGFEMFSNVAGMVIVIADVIFFYALWNIFCKNKKEKMSMMIGSVLLLLNIGLGFISSLPTSGRLIISAIAILTYSIVRYKKHCENPVFILTLFYGLRSFSLSVANSVFQYVNNSVFQLLDSSSENYIENMYLYLVYTQILLFGLYIVLFALMLTVVWKIVISFNKMSLYDVWFLSVLNVAGGLFAEVIINISSVNIKNEVFDLFQVKEELLWKRPAAVRPLLLQHPPESLYSPLPSHIRCPGSVLRSHVLLRPVQSQKRFRRRALSPTLPLQNRSCPFRSLLRYRPASHRFVSPHEAPQRAAPALLPRGS